MDTPMKQAREKRGLTQEVVAKRAGMSRSHYAEIESGKKPFNSLKAIKIAAALEIEPGDLYPAGERPADAAEKEEFMELLDQLGRTRFEKLLQEARDQVRLEDLDRERKPKEISDDED